MRKWILIGMLALTTIFCSVSIDPGSPTPDVAAIVNATLTAAAAGGASATAPVFAATDTSAPAGPSATPTLSTTPMSSFPELGTISGTIGYPAEGKPAIRVVAYPLDGSTPSYTDVAADQAGFTLDLPVGSYHVVAYSLGGTGFPTGIAAGYSQAVPCGLSVTCTDHSLITVSVTAGATLTGIDPNDYYAPDGTYPPMPSP
jgi:hypothetical protein